ncbi:unnamed protein product [Polarella glacialis]|uniref:Major facilitator superfamily (MFS) profile domain-containing protein n=1 Tax=Polarella glacialis TaxID=89957 RepID=A0A813DCV5_POLGL|nr:unnamed protein product [Polarella glacialis]
MAISPARRTLIRNVVILACAVDAADKALLPATFKVLSDELGVGPKELGALAFAQSIAFSVALPVWGSLMRYYSAKDLMVLGCFLWGALTVMIACTSTYEMQFLLRLLVGAALAVVNPVGQAIICDVVPEDERGWAFGLLQSFSAGLTMFVSFGTTAIATVTVAGVKGWRLAYMGVAGLSILAGAAAWVLVPSAVSAVKPVGQTSWLAEQKRIVGDVAHKPSFVIMVAQGVTGGIPWNAFAFLAFFFQLSGYSDLQTGQITFFGGLGGVLGGLVGGSLGDRVNGCFPDVGRCAVAQTSVVLGIGCFLWFIYIPYSATSFPILAAAFFMFNAVSCWTPAAALRPICGTIFTDSKDRAQVLALWMALEGFISSFCGAPLVGLLSEFFGYKLVQGQDQPLPAEKAESLMALRNALIGVTVLPFTLCAIAWVPMYWTYPRDRAVMQLLAGDLRTPHKQRGKWTIDLVGVPPHHHCVHSLHQGPGSVHGPGPHS